jgi:hypothetical protein
LVVAAAAAAVSTKEATDAPRCASRARAEIFNIFNFKEENKKLKGLPTSYSIARPQTSA